MNDHCCHHIKNLTVVEDDMDPGQCLVYCRCCKDVVALGVYQCLKKILERAKDADLDAQDRIASLERKLDDLIWKIETQGPRMG